MRQPPGTETVDDVAAAGNPASPSQRGDIERWLERQRTRLAEHVAVERATHLALSPAEKGLRILAAARAAAFHQLDDAVEVRRRDAARDAWREVRVRILASHG